MVFCLQYGDDGLNSNIVVPHVLRERGQRAYLTEKVYLSDPDDCIRIAKAHTQKEPNFQLFMGDSVISATDNDVWRKQRNHMVEAFLPTSSLAHIFPTSVERAAQCAKILKRLSQAGTAKVNMTEFFLNETQQQLHLALFGEKGETYDENYNATFRDSMGGPPGDDRYAARHKLAYERANRQDKSEPSERGFLTNLNKFIAKGNAKGEFAAPSDVSNPPRPPRLPVCLRADPNTGGFPLCSGRGWPVQEHCRAALGSACHPARQHQPGDAWL